MSEWSNQRGYGNVFHSEARPGAIPTGQNTPLEHPDGLYTEQINGTGFTVERSRNHRTWMYRLRPQIQQRPWERLPSGLFSGSFEDAIPTPEILRHRPGALPSEATDFVRGMATFAGAGHPNVRTGLALHLYAATADMVDTSFVNADGDLLVVPWEGSLRIRSELGWLRVAPGEIAILPRGLAYQVLLPDGSSRGFVSELFNGHYQLPERGLIGANGLADERHFLAPAASFEDRPGPFTRLHKLGGALWTTTMDYSPFDVVGWHGSYAPFTYDLRSFAPHGSVLVDHADPSVFTVLTHPHDAHGRNAVDFAVFRGRWDPTEHTFRPPFLHRNSAIEFNAVIQTPRTTGPYIAGAHSYTPYLSSHGVSAETYDQERQRAARGDDKPHRTSDEELWVQWESTYPLQVLPWVVDAAHRDRAFLDQFRGMVPGR